MLSLLLGDKVWAQELGYGHPGDIEVAHLWSQSGGGLHYVKFSMALPKNYSHPLLKKGTKVSVFRGSMSMGSATLNEADPNNWEFVADGLFNRAEKVVAYQSLDAATPPNYWYNPKAIVDDANLTKGLGWNGSGNLPLNVPADGAVANGSLPSLAEVMSTHCANTGDRWGLDSDNVPYVKKDPVTPTWALTPGVPLMPTADETSVAVVKLSYRSTSNPVDNAEVTAGTPSFDGATVRVSAGDVGIMTTAQAQAYANDYLAVNGIRYRYTEGIDVLPGDLTNTGLTPTDAWAAGILTVGKRGLHHGVIDTHLGTRGKTVTWVCGSTVFKDNKAGGTLQMYAMDLTPRTVARITALLAMIAKARADALAKAEEAN